MNWTRVSGLSHQWHNLDSHSMADPCACGVRPHLMLTRCIYYSHITNIWVHPHLMLTHCIHYSHITNISIRWRLCLTAYLAVVFPLNLVGLGGQWLNSYWVSGLSNQTSRSVLPVNAICVAAIWTDYWDMKFYTILWEQRLTQQSGEFVFGLVCKWIPKCHLLMAIAIKSRQPLFIFNITESLLPFPFLPSEPIDSPFHFQSNKPEFLGPAGHTCLGS